MQAVQGLTSLVSLIAGTAADGGFKQLVQPRALVAAAVALGLHLLFIFIPLLNAQNELALTLASWNPLWQIAVVTALLPVLGYILAALGGFCLNLVTGVSFQNTLLGEMMRGYQGLRYDDLLRQARNPATEDAVNKREEANKKRQAAIEAAEDANAAEQDDTNTKQDDKEAVQRRIKAEHDAKNAERAAAAAEHDAAKASDDASYALTRLALFFPNDRLHLAPTSLGNMILSAGSYVLAQYGVRLNTVWPVLSAELAKDDKTKALPEAVQQTQETLNFLATLTVIVLFVAFELLLLALALPNMGLLWFGVPLALCAYPIQLATVQQAQIWGQQIRAAFDQHMPTLAAALGVSELAKMPANEQREKWEKLTTWMIYGPLKLTKLGYSEEAKRQAEWYTAPSAPAQPTFKHPPQLTVESFFDQDVGDGATISGQHAYYGPRRSYLIAIANTTYTPVANAYLLVNDLALPALPAEITGSLCTSREETSRTGQRSVDGGLLWTLGTIAPQTRLLLKYTAFSGIMVVLNAHASSIVELTASRALTKYTVALNVLRGDQLEFKLVAPHMHVVDAWIQNVDEKKKQDVPIQDGCIGYDTITFVPQALHEGQWEFSMELRKREG